jgi:putative hydrolase of the HAD superfamily
MRPPLARIGKELAFLYGRPNAAGIAGRIGGLLERWEGKLRPPEGVDPRECLRRRLRLDESACLLIAYGDQFREPGAAALDTLQRALTLRLRLPVRAVLFDLYGTLWTSAAGQLDRREPAPAPDGLRELLERYGCPLSPQELAGALAAAIRREHVRRRAEGADFPEVRIERLWAELLGLEPARARAFAVEHEALANPVWPTPGLRGALRRLRRPGLRLGILSNAQFYAPLLFECFLGEGPQALGFREDLLLYSCQLGLAKPSPRLFEIARERLASAGVSAAEVLMVGNDALRDLAPARAAGFQTALFAGDARSLRGAEQAGEATAVITDLRQLPRLLERGKLV